MTAEEHNAELTERLKAAHSVALEWRREALALGQRMEDLESTHRVLYAKLEAAQMSLVTANHNIKVLSERVKNLEGGIR